MLKNYLKTTVRFLKKYKSYSIINILGLAIGIASFIIIALHVQYELSFNKHIHNNENKYRVVEIQTEPGVGEQHVAVTMGPLAKALKKDLPEVKDAVRIMRIGANTITVEEKTFNEFYFAFADSNVFEMFSIEMLYGQAEGALANPESVVLSEKLATKYFGDASEALGQTLMLEDNSFKVSGVMADIPQTSTFYFEALLQMEMIVKKFSWLQGWGSNSLDTYIELNEGTNINNFEAKLPEFIRNNVGENDWASGIEMYVQSINDIHLKSGHIKFQVTNHNQGDINEIYMFSIIAFLIMLVACINYINLSTARAVNRSKEVGVRKVMGALKSKLRIQFITESIVFAFVSTIIALLAVEFMLPFVNEILNSQMKVDFSNWILNIGLLIIIAVVGLLSGAYPAFYLSAFRPIEVLKGGLQKSGKKSGFLRKTLVVVQFSVAIVIITSTLIAMSQLNYFRTKDKGYNEEQIYSVYFSNSDSINQRRMNLFHNEFNKNPNILSIAAASGNTGVSGNQGRLAVDDTAQTPLMVRWGYFDDQFLETMQIKIKEGRGFSSKYGTDTEQAIMLNEIAVKKLGWDNPIGMKIINQRGDSLPSYKVIGVIQDYNYYSLQNPVEPAAYLFDKSRFSVLNFKLKADNYNQTVSEMKSTWEQMFPAIPFRGQFLDEQFEFDYGNQINATKIFTLFAILCITISCLGLFGLVSFVVNQRTKEVAVRKVFGSNIAQIIALINKEFAKLIIISGFIAAPLAFFYMNNWLNNFAYRIGVSWYYFAAAIFAALLIAMLTIIYHSIKTARINPSKSLKYE